MGKSGGKYFYSIGEIDGRKHDMPVSSSICKFLRSRMLKRLPKWSVEAYFDGWEAAYWGANFN